MSDVSLSSGQTSRSWGEKGLSGLPERGYLNRLQSRLWDGGAGRHRELGQKGSEGARLESADVGVGRLPVGPYRESKQPQGLGGGPQIGCGRKSCPRGAALIHGVEKFAARVKIA